MEHGGAMGKRQFEGGAAQPAVAHRPVDFLEIEEIILGHQADFVDERAADGQAGTQHEIGGIGDVLRAEADGGRFAATQRLAGPGERPVGGAVEGLDAIGFPIMAHDRAAHADARGCHQPRQQAGRGIGRHHGIIVEQPDMLDARIAQQQADAQIVAAGKAQIVGRHQQGERCHAGAAAADVGGGHFGKGQRLGQGRRGKGRHGFGFGRWLPAAGGPVAQLLCRIVAGAIFDHHDLHRQPGPQQAFKAFHRIGGAAIIDDDDPQRRRRRGRWGTALRRGLGGRAGSGHALLPCQWVWASASPLATARSIITIRSSRMRASTARPRALLAGPDSRDEPISRAPSTATDTGITVGLNTWYRVQIDVNAAGTSATCTINGTLVATNTTNIPTAAGRETGIVPGYIQKSLGANPRTLDIDYFQALFKFTSSR